MGKRAKEHRKKVVARNQKIKSAQKAYEKLYNEQMMKYVEEMREKAAAESGTTESDQSTISVQ